MELQDSRREMHDCLVRVGGLRIEWNFKGDDD